MDTWPFEDDPASPAVTTTHVTSGELPILYVVHEADEDGVSTWQFHNGIVEFRMEDAQLVRLDSILKLDLTISEIADLPIGFSARRAQLGGAWVRKKDGA